MLSIIVAIASNNAIGKDNKLLWHLPDDLKRFKKLTKGHTIIMGRKTFESLGRVLPNRKHIVLTHNPDYFVDDENVEIVNSLDVKKYIEDEEEHFVIGGALIYNMLINFCDRLYITKVEKEFDADAYFPIIDEDKWKIESESDLFKDDESGLNYRYINYIRK